MFLPKIYAQQGILFKANPQPDHYFFAPSGLRAEEGQRIFQNTSLVFFHANNTKSRGRSLGWGFVPTFLLGQTTDIPIWMTAVKRWQSPNPKINMWTGGVFIKLPEEGDAWVFHSGVTFGTKDKQISSGVFVGSSDKNTELFRGLMFNGQVRLDRKSWLICENNIVLLEEGITPVCLWGLRKRKHRCTFELAVGWTKTTRNDSEYSPQKSQYIPFPWFSAVFGLANRP